MDSPHVILALSLVLIWVSGFILGICALLAYMIHRMMKNKHWDDSNMTNALRLISHVTLHPHDFSKMWYMKWNDDHSHLIPGKRPFWYVDKDELSEVVHTRPSGDNI